MTGWWAVAFVVLWVMVAALLVIVVALARQVGTLHLRLGPRGALEMDDEGPALGEAPPPLVTVAPDGRRFMLGGPGPTRLVMFTSPTCGICKEVAAAAVGVAAQLVSDPGAEREWNVPGTPFVVVLDPSGIVRAKGTVNNLEQVEGLLDTARARTGGTAWAS
jgi:hypothetical protein